MEIDPQPEGTKPVYTAYALLMEEPTVQGRLHVQAGSQGCLSSRNLTGSSEISLARQYISVQCSPRSPSHSACPQPPEGQRHKDACLSRRHSARRQNQGENREDFQDYCNPPGARKADDHFYCVKQEPCKPTEEPVYVTQVRCQSVS